MKASSSALAQNPPCPKCGKAKPVVRAGYNRSGSQRLRCQGCGIYFTPQRKPMGYDPMLREQALKLYLEGTSFRAIGRLLSVNHQSVANWINEAARQLPSRVTDGTPTDTVETDELFTFVGKKSTKST